MGRHQYGGTPARRTANQETLQNAIDRFVADCSFGGAFRDWLEHAGVRITRAKKVKGGRWDLYLVLPERLEAMFAVDLELLCVVADFARVEPRVLADLQQQLRAEGRVDSELALLASRNDEARSLTRRRAGETAVVAIAATELGLDPSQSLEAVLAREIVTVDHFNVTTPITDPGSFFGRGRDVDEAVHHIEAGQHLGLFGLRKSGKSSLLNQVERTMLERGWAVSHIDLNGYIGRPERVRTDIVRGITTSRESRPQRSRDSRQEKGDWLDRLEDRAAALKASATRVPGILIVVDEIDTVLPGRVEASGGDLKDRSTMLKAMVQLRAFAQTRAARGETPVVLLSAGVDATVFELPKLRGAANPLYQFSVVRFLEPLDRKALHTMVRTLGKRCGMSFTDPRLIDELLTEYGGHPLLSRQACSWVHRHRPVGRVPYTVPEQALLDGFTARGTGTPLAHAHDTLDELAEWYPDDAAQVLAALNGDRPDPTQMNHAIDYGLVDAEGDVRMRSLTRRL